MTERAFGAQSMVGRLREVLLVPPGPMDAAACGPLGWSAFERQALVAEFEALRRLLEGCGASVHLGEASPAENPDAIYAYDPLLVTEAGLVLLRPGKVNRRAEPEAQARTLSELGIPVLGRIEAPGRAESGDLLWLSERVLCAGLGWRTNAEGVAQLRALLAPLGVTVEAFDLPNFSGPEQCLHLMSLVSLVSRSLAVVAERLMPVRLVQLLGDSGVSLIASPEEEFDTLGTNVLAVDDGVVVALEQNRLTNARMRAAGLDVRTFQGQHLCVPGTGGPTCLTRPLWRQS